MAQEMIGETGKRSARQTAILYFSVSGTTETAAQAIHRCIPGSTLIRLEPQQPYGDYESTTKRGDVERQQNIHPALKNLPDLTKYQNIFIGFPTWWARPPMVIHTVFDVVDLSGKTIIPFATSMGTSISESMPTMRQLAASAHAHITDGFLYNGDQSALQSWLQQLGF